jgi:NAD+ kinase
MSKAKKGKKQQDLSHVKKILVVYKRSTYEQYVEKNKNHPIAKLYQEKHPATEDLFEAHQEHKASLEKVMHALRLRGLKAEMRRPVNMGDVRRYDLVLTIGGDGTFLQASHAIKDHLVVGINSSPTRSIGALCGLDADTFIKRLDDILKGQYTLKVYPRMQIKVNGSILPQLALNDVLLTNKCPAETSRYIIKWGAKEEDQKSSGVWVSTAAGSSAAISVAGGKSMSSHLEKIQFAVREPYPYPKQKEYKLLSAMINKGKSVSFINKMIAGCLYIDGGYATHNLHFGDEIEFETSDCPINIIT